MKTLIFTLALFVFPVVGEAQTIVYSRLTGGNWQIWEHDIKADKARQLTDSAVDKRYPQCNARHDFMLYTTANGELFKLDTATGRSERLLERFGQIMDYEWSADGKSLLFTRLRNDLIDDSDVWITDLAGKDPRQLTRGAGLQSNPAWINEEEIVYVSRNREKGGHNLVHLNLETGASTPLTEGGYFDVMPDGSGASREVVFSSNRAESYDIWTIDPVTKRLAALTDYFGLDADPVFSPDASQILYASTAGGSRQIWLMDADGGNKRELTKGDEPRQDAAWCR